MSRRYGDRWVELLSFTNIEEPEGLAERYLDDTGPDSIARLRDLLIWLSAERLIVGSFSNSCDRVALPIPGIDSPGSMMSPITERAIVVGRRPNKDVFYREVPIYEPSSAHALAQHMKLPTRLLDFTDNPLKAAYFAMVEGLPLIQGLGPDHSCIWVASPPAVDEDTLKFLMLLGDETRVIRVLRSEIPFLHAQDGLFVCCNASANQHFLMNGAWPNFEQIMHRWSLEKLLLPIAEMPSLRDCLNRLGINSTTLMPSYEQAAIDARGLL